MKDWDRCVVVQMYWVDARNHQGSLSQAGLAAVQEMDDDSLLDTDYDYTKTRRAILPSNRKQISYKRRL